MPKVGLLDSKNLGTEERGSKLGIIYLEDVKQLFVLG
jgi:hypothetical protein